MERDWTNPRDNTSWKVKAYDTGVAMATEGQLPDAGETRIRFRNGADNHSTRTKVLLDPNELDDAELQELLDRARRER